MRWVFRPTTCWTNFRAGAIRRLRMSSSTSLTTTRSNLPSTDVARINIVSAVVFLLPVLAGALSFWLTVNPAGLFVGVLLGLLLSQAPKIARQWERAVVLRLGKYVGLRG